MKILNQKTKYLAKYSRWYELSSELVRRLKQESVTVSLYHCILSVCQSMPIDNHIELQTRIFRIPSRIHVHTCAVALLVVVSCTRL